jgi:hypothetical protein
MAHILVGWRPQTPKSANLMSIVRTCRAGHPVMPHSVRADLCDDRTSGG